MVKSVCPTYSRCFPSRRHRIHAVSSFDGEKRRRWQLFQNFPGIFIVRYVVAHILPPLYVNHSLIKYSIKRGSSKLRETPSALFREDSGGEF